MTDSEQASRQGLLKELIAEARHGSQDALGRLLEQLRPYLLQVAFEEMDSDLRVKESPSDLVQKTFLEAAHGLAALQGDTPAVVQAWLRQILLNNIQDLRDRYRTDKRQLAREVGAVEQLAPALAAAATPPLEAAIQHEQASILEAALAQLAPAAREVIWLRHREGRSFKEIATELRISEEAARKRWARSVAELRQLAQGGGIE